MEEKQVKTSKKQDLTPIRNEKGQIISGTANPNGRPPNTKNFSTIFREAVKKIAEAQGIEEAEVEYDLVIKAISEAKKGKYQYHKDIFDRVYGQAEQRHEVDMKQPIAIVPQALIERFNLDEEDEPNT